MDKKNNNHRLIIGIKIAAVIAAVVAVAVIASNVIITKSLASYDSAKPVETSMDIEIVTFAANVIKAKKTVILPECEDTKDGYTFVGWCEKDGLYSPGNTITKYADDPDSEAKWAVSTTTIVERLPDNKSYADQDVFDLDGTSASILLNDGETIISLKDAYEMYGLRIAGPLVAGQDSITGYFTYDNIDYAFVLEGFGLDVSNENDAASKSDSEISGIEDVDDVISYKDVNIVKISKPKKSGYTFVGWNTATDCIGISYRSGDELKIGDVSTLYSIWRESAEVEKMLELGYWYVGIDEDIYSAKLAAATGTVPTPGVGWCALWVSYVYQEAGLGFIGGDARDMWAYFGVTDDTADIKEGMLIAVPHSPSCALGWEYGHVGVIIMNPDYVGTDSAENRMSESEMKEKLLEAQEEKERLENIIKNAQIDEEADRSEERSDVSDTQKKLEEKVAMAKADLNEIEGTILQLQDQLNEISTKIVRNNDYTEVIDGFTYEYDCYGHEKWVVVHNNGTIKTTPLSGWISYYNATNEIKWGWGHLNVSEPINFYQDIPATIKFAVLEEETIKSEADNQTTAAAEDKTTKDQTTKSQTTKDQTTKDQTTKEHTTTATAETKSTTAASKSETKSTTAATKAETTTTKTTKETKAAETTTKEETTEAEPSAAEATAEAMDVDGEELEVPVSEENQEQ